MVLIDAGGPIVLVALGGVILLVLGLVAGLVGLAVYLTLRATKKNRKKEK